MLSLAIHDTGALGLTTKNPCTDEDARIRSVGIGTHVDSVATLVVHYRINSALLMSDYKGNRAALDSLRTILSADNPNPPDYIYITASASPDGSTSQNSRLSLARARALRDYMLWRHPHFDEASIRLSSMGEDWEGLRALVSGDERVPHRERVLEELASSADANAKRIRIQAIGGGAAYRYIAEKMLPDLRMACAVVAVYGSAKDTAVEDVTVVEETVKPITETSVEVEPATEPATEPIAEPEPVAEPQEVQEAQEAQKATQEIQERPEVQALQTKQPARRPRPMPFALKTNLLFDALTALNFEAEVPIGDRWSVSGEYTFPWWLGADKQNATQLIMGIVEGRYWPGDRSGKAQLTGWFAGVHGGGGYYDLERRAKGWQGEFFVVGVSGGYAHTLGRSGRWRMEYSLGLGYMSSGYREYRARIGVDDEWHLIRIHDGRVNWFGPTRAKVSLGWMFGTGKGGAQ